MTPDDEQFLRGLYEDLRGGPLEPTDARYVSPARYPGAFGHDIASELAKAIAWAPPGEATYLSGTRGSGKSTQLLSLRRRLLDRGYAAVRVDAEQYINMALPVDVSTLLFAIVGGVQDAAAAEGWLPEPGRASSLWQSFTAMVKELRPGVEGVGLFGVDLKVKMARDPAFATQVKDFLRGRSAELALLVDQSLQQITEELRPRWPQLTGSEWKGLVILFDSLDHLRGDDFSVSRRALQATLDAHAVSLQPPSSRILYVVPPWVHVGGATQRFVCSIKVCEPDGSRYEPGIAALVETIERRTPDRDLDRIFARRADLESLLADSGGHLRDALRLVRDAATTADTLPFSPDVLAYARQLSVQQMTPLADDEKAALRHVRATQERPLPTESAWEALASLFDRHLLLGYRNGHEWYGVHPLVADLID